MRQSRMLCVALLPLMLGAATVAAAQGKGQGKAHGRGNEGKGKGALKSEVARVEPSNRGRSMAATKGKGNARKGSDRSIVVSESHGNVSFREFALSPRRGHRLAGLAVASAARRRANDGDAFVIRPVANRVQVLNRSGVVLVDFDDDRELGHWTVVTTPFREKKGAPSFCRSGAGHPVWGRQWCVEKGFGLGADRDLRWSRVLDPTGVVITRPTTSDLTRDVLLDVLGSVVLNRLATHAVTLGYQDPLTGRWLGDATDPRTQVLLVSAGPQPVAELVDLNRDGRADLMLVTTRR